MSMKPRIFSAILLMALLFRLPVLSAEDRLVIRSGDKDSKRIALTFDDGPHPKRTDEILDLLEHYKLRATFFVIGENAVHYPEPLKRAAKLGHEIGNHTFSHGNVTSMSISELQKELSDTERVIKALTDTSVHLFRPPEGACSKSILTAARASAYSVILWTIDTEDWALAKTETIVKNVKKNVCGGSILLFHDYTTGSAHTLDALKLLIPYLLEEGYEFVTVSELMKSG